MIGLVADTINWCVACVGTLLTAVAFIGQAIVSLVASLFYGACGVIDFLANVYKDNRSAFGDDLPSMVIHAPVAVLGHFQTAADVIIAASSEVLAYGGILVYLGTSCISIIVSTLVKVAMDLKNMFILIGNSLWLIVTFIPFQLPILLAHIFSYIWSRFVDIVVSAYGSLLKLTNFLTDVPLQSLVGIVSSVVIVRLFVDFREEILSGMSPVYWALVRRLLIHYYSIYNYFTNADTRIITQLVHENQLTQGSDQDGAGGMDALCVVCQERQKCVLILPCRHICLCRECCTRLYRYQRTCPICRAFIYHSVAVYI